MERFGQNVYRAEKHADAEFAEEMQHALVILVALAHQRHQCTGINENVAHRGEPSLERKYPEWRLAMSPPSNTAQPRRRGEQLRRARSLAERRS